MSFFLVHVGLPCGWTGSFAFNCSKWQEAKEKAHSLPSWNLLYSCFTWGTNWRNWFSLTEKMTRNLSKSTRHYLHLQLTGNSSHFLTPACSGQGYWGRAAVLGRTFFFLPRHSWGKSPPVLVTKFGSINCLAPRAAETLAQLHLPRHTTDMPWPWNTYLALWSRRLIVWGTDSQCFFK